MLTYTTRPISDRSPFTGNHIHSAFRTNWLSQLDLLGRECEHLRGQNLVIEVDVDERGIRLDGGLRADAKPDSPAVRVAFESKHGPIMFATDRFWSWRDNVYAIAKSLEALRMVDRYGVTKRGEQYTGWKAIGSGIALGPGMSYEVAMATIAKHAFLSPRATVDNVRGAIRAARANTHPDRNSGTREAWDLVEQAAQVLEVGA